MYERFPEPSDHEALHKGMPQTGRQLLADVSLPAAVIHEPALAHNLAWMQAFCEAQGRAWRHTARPPCAPSCSAASSTPGPGASPWLRRPSAAPPSSMACAGC
ncbi:hypothetical protein [Halomonas sp. E19]|uniref:hypothetical protein n=1 Tax=Halomonas sp. E19 TaxID=3397247 RepID=UPI0040338FA0